MMRGPGDLWFKGEKESKALFRRSVVIIVYPQAGKELKKARFPAHVVQYLQLFTGQVLYECVHGVLAPGQENGYQRKTCAERVPAVYFGPCLQSRGQLYAKTAAPVVEALFIPVSVFAVQ